MEIFTQVIMLLLSLSLLIVLHEFGHFIPARLFGTRVEKFYLFFDYKWSLFKKKIGDTEWGIGWIPLGGYVKISGMIDESMDKEQMAGPAQPWEFRAKPAWQRLIIMVGGVTVNLILAYLIYVMLMWKYGEQILPTEHLTDGVMITNPVAEDMGFKDGDKILKINGEAPPRFRKLTEEFLHGGTVTVERSGQEMDIVLPVSAAGDIIEGAERPLFYPRIPFFVANVPDSSINAESGLQEKDKIIALNGSPMRYKDEVAAVLKANPGRTLKAQVQRDEELVDLDLAVNESGLLEVNYIMVSMSDLNQSGLYDFQTLTYDFGSAWGAGWRKTSENISSYVGQLKLLLKPSSGAYKGLGGFGTIAKLYPKTWDWHQFWRTTALISLILAVMNILPIPALDGGHVMFLLFEIVTGREPSQKFLERAQMIGFFILIALLLYANGNDVVRWLTD